jgi:hypothetical protein
MAGKRNPIIDADIDDDFDVNEFAEREEEFGVTDASDDEFTTDDVADTVRDMSERERAKVNSTRREGRAAPAGPQRGRTTKAQEVAKARAPARVRDVEWKPSDTLDAPPPMPGMEGRWVRFRVGTEDDQKNFSSKQRGGWEPRKVSTVPKGYFPPTMRHSQLGEVIAVGDLIYCERPRSIGLAQKKYFREKLRRQTLAGQRHIKKVERPDHPIDVDNKYERPSVGYGKKRRVAVQDDE